MSSPIRAHAGCCALGWLRFGTSSSLRGRLAEALEYSTTWHSTLPRRVGIACGLSFALVYMLVPLAADRGTQGRDAWAARIPGVRDAVMERTAVAIVDSRVYNLRGRAEREARARLGPNR